MASAKLPPGLLAFACAIALAGPLGAARPALAEPAGDLGRARELFLEGSRLAETGDWEGARDRFERSLREKRAALTLYNLGIAQQETGRLAAAVESFRAFLALPVEPATQPYVEPVRGVVATLDARLPRVSVDVRPAGVPGVVVHIDGREAAPGTAPWRVDPGHHDVTAAAPGYHDAYQAVTLAEGARTTVSLDLVPGETRRIGVTLPAALGIGGLALLVGGGVVLGVGAAQGLGSPDAGSSRLLLTGGAIEGAGALALGAGLLVLLTRTTAHPKPPAAASSAASASAVTTVTPWSSGRVAGLAVSF